MARETWVIRVLLPANVSHGGRFMARLLKHLLRTWRVKCVALLDTLPETNSNAQGKPSAKQTARPSSAAPDGS